VSLATVEPTQERHALTYTKHAACLPASADLEIPCISPTMSNPAERAGVREWTGLAVLALPTLLASIDVSVLLLALPRISAGLGADSTQQIVDHGHIRLHAGGLHDHHGYVG
jgi:hypothetical protein